jgi:hypothetical protein
MYQRLFFGELTDFLKGLGHHLTDMNPIEVLTLAPLAALVVLFGVFPGLLLDLIAGSIANVLGDVASQPPVSVAPEIAALAVLIPIIYVIVRVIVVANTDRRRAAEATDLARATGAGG